MQKSKQRTLQGAAAAVALVVAASAAPDEEREAGAVGLEPIKALAGTWVEVGEDGQVTDQVVSSYRVIASGSAVVETIFEGSEHEMLTVYHLDGDALVLTHYCMEGNQPHHRARRAGPKELVFECQGGTNLSSEDDRHMHRGQVRWIDDDHIETEWRLLEAGENTYTASFRLERRR